MLLRLYSGSLKLLAMDLSLQQKMHVFSLFVAEQKVYWSNECMEQRAHAVVVVCTLDCSAPGRASMRYLFWLLFLSKGTDRCENPHYTLHTQHRCRDPRRVQQCVHAILLDDCWVTTWFALTCDKLSGPLDARHGANKATCVQVELLETVSAATAAVSQDSQRVLKSNSRPNGACERRE